MLLKGARTNFYHQPDLPETPTGPYAIVNNFFLNHNF